MESVACHAGATPKTPPFRRPSQQCCEAALFREEGVAGHPSMAFSYENHVQRRHGTPRSEPQFCVQGRKGGACRGRQGSRPCLSAPACPQIEGQADFPWRGSELQWLQMVRRATLLCLRAPWHCHCQRHRGQQWGTPMACCGRHCLGSSGGAIMETHSKIMLIGGPCTCRERTGGVIWTPQAVTLSSLA